MIIDETHGHNYTFRIILCVIYSRVTKAWVACTDRHVGITEIIIYNNRV